MRILLLLLMAWPALAVPITFTFEGTWDIAEPGEYVIGLPVQRGTPFSGSFTFERLSQTPGDIRAEMFLTLGAAVFISEYFIENSDGWYGQGAAYTEGPLCNSPVGPLQCRVVFGFFGETNGQVSGFGLWARSDLYHGFFLGSLPIGPVQPYTPFLLPEASTIVQMLLGLALLSIWHFRRSRPSRSLQGRHSHPPNLLAG